MKKITVYLLGFVELLTAGCSHKIYFDQSPSANLSSFRSYAFLPKVDSSFVSVYNGGIVDELIHKSITAEIGHRNFAIDTNTPDLLIEFHLMVKKREDIVNTTQPFSPTFYGYPMRNYYGQARYRPANFRMIEYKEETLVIDFFERATGKLVWRGWSVSSVENFRKFEARIPDVVKKILGNYPVRLTMISGLP